MLKDIPTGMGLRYNLNAVCPYCGKIHKDSSELDLSDEESTTTICKKCENEFEVICNIEITYSTSKMEKAWT